MKINWHRLFGLLLMDYFSDRGFTVELEKDLSLKRQYLDVVIIEQKDKVADLSGICDGFDNLCVHNLLTYKSKRQSLNFWALEELIGHYVNYRWQLDDGSTVINQLLEKYSLEGITMPYTMEEFRREYIKAHLGDLDPEERLKGLRTEERLKGLKAEERLKGLRAEERLKGLRTEERLKGLKAEEIEAYLKNLKKDREH